MTASLDAAVASALDELAGLEPARLEIFELRVRRWWPDLHDGLAGVYGDRADDLAGRLVRRTAAAYRERDPELTRLDLARTLEPDWFQSPSMIGYAAYADRFAGDLAGVRNRLP